MGHCTRAIQLLSKKCRSGEEPLATLCPIWPARDLNLRPPAPGTNALSLDQLDGRGKFHFEIKETFAGTKCLSLVWKLGQSMVDRLWKVNRLMQGLYEGNDSLFGLTHVFRRNCSSLAPCLRKMSLDLFSTCITKKAAQRNFSSR